LHLRAQNALVVAFNVKALTLAMTCAHCKEHRQAIWLQKCPCTEFAMVCKQLGVDGGPQTGFTIQFDSTNLEFVKIDPTSGLLEAMAPGQTVSSDL
jgi:hypothetical protein